MPDQTGRVAVVTGANSGIGLEAARALARKGARVTLAVRDTERGRSAADDIEASTSREVAVRRLDLADLSSVDAFASECLAAHADGIDLLINNAGVMATPLRRTADGFELQFGTNHLGHFALTAKLMPAILLRPGSRVVTVASHAHRMGGIDFDDLNWERSYTRWGAYGRSKLANLLFAFELQRLIERSGADARSIAAHPGYTATNLQSVGPSLGGGLIAAVNTAGARLGNILIGQPAEKGALPTLRAAVDPGVTGGSYVGPGGPFEARGRPKLVKARRLAYNASVAARLWEESERLTGTPFAT